jgi:hypothetical protein
MNGPQLHLIVNHIPVFGTAFGSLLLLAGLLKKSTELKRAGLLFLIIASLATIPTYYSGEASPRVVKALPGVVRPYIHNHAEAAEWAFIMIGVLGAAALATWLFSLQKIGIQIGPISSVLFFPSGGCCMVRTANLGGEIRHTEIRQDFIPPPLLTPLGPAEHADH